VWRIYINFLFQISSLSPSLLQLPTCLYLTLLPFCDSCLFSVSPIVASIEPHRTAASGCVCNEMRRWNQWISLRDHSWKILIKKQKWYRRNNEEENGEEEDKRKREIRCDVSYLFCLRNAILVSDSLPMTLLYNRQKEELQ
jgi:hypothetical protein